MTVGKQVDPAYAYNYSSFVYKGEEYVIPNYVLREWEQHGRLAHSQIVALASKRGYYWRVAGNGLRYLTLFMEKKPDENTKGTVR